MTSSYFGILQLVILASWLVTLLWGSIMAVRGARNWSTVLQVVGTGSLLAGAVSFGISIMLVLSAFTSGMGSSPTSPASSASSGVVWGVVAAVSTILFLLGVVLFTAGYVGMCAKYAASERRSRELEGLMGQLQQRMQSEM